MDRKSDRKKLALRKAQNHSTPSSRRHHFVPFTQRIASLKIDPIRRQRNHDDHEDSDLTSHFRTSLDKWRELNQSDDFTRFSRQVDSLCDSLPQVLHHQNRIIDLLLEYIAKGTTVAVEPLLDLVPRLAQDVQAQFETHFERTVTTITTLAAKHADLEVVEWSFNCLAWLFKYLERLLVSDLRPLYTLLAPLLGREKQRDFVIRFAAESLSFLVKKASKKRDSLATIVNFALDDLCQTANGHKADLYEAGLRSLFLEAILNMQMHIHSKGDVIFQQLLSQVLDMNGLDSRKSEPAVRVLRDVLGQLVHRTRSETFKPVLAVLLAQLQPQDGIINENRLKISAQLLLLVIGVKGGSRVMDWCSILDLLSSYIYFLSAHNPSTYPEAATEVLAAFALTHQTCPLDVAISFTKVFEEICCLNWQQFFLGFCSLYAELGNDRFRTLLLSYFQKFIAKFWNVSNKTLCVLLPQLIDEGHLRKGSVKLPSAWASQIVDDFNRLLDFMEGSGSERFTTSYLNGLFEMSRSMPMEPELASEINHKIYQGLSRLLSTSTLESPTPLETLILGNGFRYIANSPTKSDFVDLWPLLCSASANLHDSLIYLQSLLEFIQTPDLGIDIMIPQVEVLVDALMDPLSSPSHDLRLVSLEILQVLMVARDNVAPKTIQNAINIERTEPTLETARAISLQIRGLAASYHTVAADPWLDRALPKFCFGLLHVKYSQIVEDACVAFKELCNSKEGEEVTCATAFQWLEGHAPAIDNEVKDEAPPNQITSHHMDNAGEAFDNLKQQIRRNMSLEADIDERLDSMFRQSHRRVRLTNGSNRLHALKVLKKVPEVAEKRSRSLVPVLLAWATRLEPIQVAEEGEDHEMEDAPSDRKTDQRWARKEQKALLSLFADFANPKVLYKSAEVQAALLSLLELGDAEIQKSALQALFTWKNPSVQRNQKDLEKLLDDAKFREQISVFLDVSGGDGSLRADDREAVMPIVLRLLYGRVTTRGKKGDQQANRRAVFVLLSRFTDVEVNEFIDIALGALSRASLVQNETLIEEELQVNFLSQRKQLGLLNMLKDLLDTWKSKAAPFASRLADPIFYCLIRALRDMAEQETDTASHNTLARSVRLAALQCLNMLFEYSPVFDWKPYMPLLFEELINPRLGKLAIETAQAISALLRMFGAWSHSETLAPFLANYNPELLIRVAECIGLSTAKDEVKRFVTNEVVGSLITQADAKADSSQEITALVKTYAPVFLDQLALLLRSDPQKDLLEDSVQAVVRLAEYTATCPAEILSSAAFLLQMPARRASHKIKINLLKILLRFLPTLKGRDDISDQIYVAVCASFAHFKDRESRTLLSRIVCIFAEKDHSLLDINQLCEGLNSFVSGRLDQPDRELQSRAFFTINEERYLEFTTKQWKLLLGNLMFYVKEFDESDMRDSDATRANASYSLRRFVEAASQKNGDEKEEFMNIIKETVLVGIEKGIRDQPKDVQAEYLAVLAHIIKLHPEWPVVNDMQTLLAGDEEASFFINIHHTQHHRRTRAMKRLAEKVSQGSISSNNIYRLIIPLVERFVFDNEEGPSETAGAISNRGLLTAEAIRTLGVLVEWIDWQQCRVLLKRFIGFVKTKSDMQETILKLLDAVTASICHSARLKLQTEPPQLEDMMEDASTKDQEVETATRLSRTMPGKDKMTQYLVQDVITPLALFLHDKDESYASRRISVAVIVARFIQLLPDDEFQIRLPALLTDTCNILRSKDQGSRDMTRKALTTICTLIGPSSVGFVLRELRSALQRGFYLHVLSFTLHSILETTTPSFKPGDLDYCASDIVSIIMEDVFGNTGKEKEAAEYLKDKNTKKEVKGKKSFDSMQLLASVTSLTHLIDLVRPIENLLLGRVNHKDVRHIDELLRRIELGLLQNPSVRDRDVLVFCYEIIKDTQQIAPAKNGANKQAKYSDQSGDKVATNSYRSREAIGRLTRFSLELVRAVLRKHKELQTPANIAGFMPIIGDALVSKQDDVKLASIRLYTGILNIPLPQIDDAATTFIAQAAQIIEDCPTTNDELSQAALKLIATVLRERRSSAVKVKEKTLAMLLKKMKPDLQVISQQGVAFNLLRSIIARKIVLPEVYEVIDGDDGVAAISVRDHDRTTRDLARGVYCQFLMEYPQSEGRFAKQLTFLVRNLEYEHAEGRQSVMETIHFLLQKVGDTLVQQIVSEACWPLVSVMVNDDSSDCKEMASGLVKVVFSRADDDWIKNFLALFQRMVEHGTKDIQKRTALQCWTIYLEVKGSEAKEGAFVQKTIAGILEQDDEGFNSEEWQLIYYALHTFLMICKHKPETAFGAKTQALWDKVQLHLSFPQSWVKQEAAKLIGMFVADFAASNPSSLDRLPLVGSQGLKVDGKKMCDLTARNLRLLREGVSEDLATQVVRNLAFLGRCFATNEMEWQRPKNSVAAREATVNSEHEDENDNDEEAEEEEAAKENPSAIQHLFHRLAGTIRRELLKPTDPTAGLYRRASVLTPKTAALKLVSALCATLPIATLTPSLPTIFLPLIHLTDRTITAPTSQDAAFTEAYQSLVDSATELMVLLQEKLGITEYVKVSSEVRKAIQRRRDERRVKRKIEAVSMPERAEKVKMRKRGNEKIRRREKGAVARGMRRGW